MLGILGKKIGMSQFFEDSGRCVPVTAIVAGPCFVIQIKDKDKDGYRAVQLGFMEKKEKKTSKAQLGHFKKGKLTPKRFIREIQLRDDERYELGQKIEVDIFKTGDFVDVTATSIGRGFQGGMKRWGWSSGPKTHGSMSHRRPGSIGTSATPSRVLKGHHLPGHMGNRKTTVQNLEIINVDKENNVLMVKGAIPGHKCCFVFIGKAKKK